MCDIGPGKFEREPVETLLLYAVDLDGNAEDTVSDEWGEGASLHTWNASDVGWQGMAIDFAREYGVCGEHIIEAIRRTEGTIGAILSWSDVGFVSSAFYRDTETLNRDWEAIVNEIEPSVPTDGHLLAELVLRWARTPGNHGGNPYCLEFVKLARRMIGDDD